MDLAKHLFIENEKEAVHLGFPLLWIAGILLLSYGELYFLFNELLFFLRA